ncbi:aconitate hydratase AcnA [Acuticoccus kandeliae]|uniref:aconitate hydratase AcnA n=1 Tax=Acuticoccus kandeliae TaxID=2073160 RepID=UPI000D3EB394|nr:aconitate hydratase AcnA [Acuticoccus kandeliae]
MSLDSFNVRVRLEAPDGEDGFVFSLPRLADQLGIDLSRLPYSLRVLLENLARHEDGDVVTRDDIAALAAHVPGEGRARGEIAYHPTRVLMPDSSGVPAVADLAGLRDVVREAGGDPEIVDSIIPVDVVIDHSVMVDVAGIPNAVEINMAREFARGRERYALLRWAENAFERIRIVPPGNGILHQINLEYLATVVSVLTDGGERTLVPDTMVGTDSHTPMVNGIGVVGWGVGGIEAASAMLGQPISMLVPPVTGCRIAGRLKPGVTATDLVLHLTERFRRAGVVGHFVEFCGAGLDHLAVTDRATIANMAPEWGATMGFFPIDAQTIRYLEATGRDARHLSRVEAYARAQMLWRDGRVPAFDQIVDIDLGEVAPTLAGPSRPDQKVSLGGVAERFDAFAGERRATTLAPAPAGDAHPVDGDIVIAAITSCTNTSNPSVMLAAGLLARNAVRRGLTAKPWVKTSLSPGSRRVTDYLTETGLQDDLDALGFQTVGYGCMTCMGNSGPLAEPIEAAIKDDDLTVVAVLSGNRNFEGRVHQLVRASFLASPPLVVAYAIAGTVRIDLETEPLGTDRDGEPVYLRDLWPSDEEIASLAQRSVRKSLFVEGYRDILRGPALWQSLKGPAGATFPWDAASTYLRFPPYTRVDDGVGGGLADITSARPIAMLGDNVTTDHIAPVGAIPLKSAVGTYLTERGVAPIDFDSLSSRRANAEIVARTAFANVRLRNELAGTAEGSVTVHQPSGEAMSIFDAAERYRAEGAPLIVVAGKNYGAGSSRDTAAKSVRLLGVRAVLAEGFERIHRSNLVGMGVVPLQFIDGMDRHTLALTGVERFDITGLTGTEPGGSVRVRIHRADGTTEDIIVRLRIDTRRERDWVRSGGILPFVGRALLATTPRGRAASAGLS